MKYFLTALLIIATILTPAVVIAARFENPLGFDIRSGPGAADAVRDIISNIITFFLNLSAFVALAGITFGGYRLIIGSFTSEQAVASAKQIILWSVLGLVVIGISTALLRAIEEILL